MFYLPWPSLQSVAIYLIFVICTPQHKDKYFGRTQEYNSGLFEKHDCQKAFMFIHSHINLGEMNIMPLNYWRFRSTTAVARKCIPCGQIPETYLIIWYHPLYPHFTYTNLCLKACFGLCIVNLQLIISFLPVYIYFHNIKACLRGWYVYLHWLTCRSSNAMK